MSTPTPTEFGGLPSCPWCSIPLSIHDKTINGAACNVRIAMARIAAIVRIERHRRTRGRSGAGEVDKLCRARSDVDHG